MKLKVEYIPIDELKPYDKNAKIHTQEQIEQIKESIQEFGMNDPIGIWGKENLIVEGHGRLLACKELGMKEVPVIRLDDLTDDQRRAYTLVHNQTTMNTGFDLDILNEELEDIDIDMGEFGFEQLEEDDIEPINDEGLEKTESFEHKLKIDNQIIILTEEEYTEFMSRYDAYIDENGVNFGFIKSLLGGGDDD